MSAYPPHARSRHRQAIDEFHRDPERHERWRESIRHALTGKQSGAVRRRYDIAQRLTVNTRQGRQHRRCLCCSQDFLSEGPHNRMCQRCRIDPVIRE